MKIFAGHVKKSKKGSLELSINAIVILVLAITLLGLGLTFIRGMFNKATDKLGGFVDAADLENPPTAEDPVGVADKITIKVSETRELKIGYYNNNRWAWVKTGDAGKGTANSVQFFIQGCKSTSATTGTAAVPSVRMVPGTVQPSKAEGFKIILSITDTGLLTKPDVDPTSGDYNTKIKSAFTVADATPNPFNTAGTYICTLRVVGDKDSGKAVSTTTALTRVYADKSFFLEVVS